MKKLTLLVIAALLIILSVGGTTFYYKSHLGANVPAAEKLIQTLTNHKVTIEQHFNAADSLMGFVVKENTANGPKAIFYTNDEGNVLIAGNLLTLVHGRPTNLSAQIFMQKIESKASIKAFQTIEQTHYFTQGSNSAPHKLWVVADPNCIACHMAYEALQPKIKSGQVQVRWILVAFRKPSSAGKAYAIWATKDPVKSMMINEQLFNVSTEEGGIQPLINPTAEMKSDLKENMVFMLHNEIAETPTFFYKTKTGETRVMGGLPRPQQFDKLIADIGDQF